MNANDWLELITQLFFILLSGITIIDFLRYRDTARRDIALMFCSLSMAIWVQFVTKLLGIAIPWLTSLAVIAFLAQPYLMLRLVQFFRPVPFAVRYVALLTMVVSWLTILFGHAPYSIILVLVVIANFVVIDGFAMFAFVRGAMTTSGVVRKRLRFVAAGSGLLASLLLIAGIFSAFPEALPLATSLIQIVAIAAALAFYLGFASPRWLRHAWQLTELRNYLLESATKQTPAQMGVSESLNRLCQAANRAVGGMAAAVIQWNEAPGLRSMSAVTDGSTFLRGLLINQPIIEKAWRERRAIVIYSSNKLDTGDYQLLKSVGADTLL